jgi:hypothetical protein
MKHKALELYVVLDTNALYTGSASYFVAKEVAELVAAHRALPDLTISWYVPSTVRDERHFQMLMEGRKLLEPIAKLERLLGHNLNITPDILDTRVREAIERQVVDHGLLIIPFEPGKIDWARLASDSAFRRPPFQPGDREKGFRDALVLESFVQLVESSPSSPSVCRVAFVTGDELLRTAAERRVSGATNVYILESLEALKGLVSTLGSAVDEQFIKGLQPKAVKLFYTPGNRESLYYRWGVNEQLNKTLAAALVTLPSTADRYTVEEWSIATPRFSKKQGQKVSWVSRFEAALKAVKEVQVSPVQQSKYVIPSFSFPPSPDQNVLSASIFGAPPGHGVVDPRFVAPVQSAFISTNWSNALSQEHQVATGTARIDVTWTVSVTTALALKSPKLDRVEFVDATWE